MTQRPLTLFPTNSLDLSLDISSKSAFKRRLGFVDCHYQSRKKRKKNKIWFTFCPIAPLPFYGIPEELLEIIFSFGSFEQFFNFRLVSTWCWRVFWKSLHALCLRDTSEKKLISILQYADSNALLQIQLDNCNITAFSMRFITSSCMTNIRSLWLSGCSQIDDKALFYIRYLSSLRTLNLTGCKKITDVGMRSIPFLEHLIRLSVFYCNQITDIGVKLISQAPNIQTLDLSGCTLISDSAICHIATSLLGLRALGLGGCPKITNEGLKNLLSNKHLVCLGLAHTQISSPGLRLLSKLTALTALDLSHCTNMTEGAFLDLKCFSKLQKLNISHTVVSDRNLWHLRSLRKLEEVKVHSCPNVSGAGLVVLQQSLPRLILNINV